MPVNEQIPALPVRAVSESSVLSAATKDREYARNDRDQREPDDQVDGFDEVADNRDDERILQMTDTQLQKKQHPAFWSWLSSGGRTSNYA
jgi:hypothetical protein